MTRGEERFSYIFAPELYERLRWFVRLRWWAAVGLLVTSIFGPALGLPGAWPALGLLGGFVCAYNVFFRVALARREQHPGGLRGLRSCALRQMVMDLVALLVTAHFTGGMLSPVLPFFTIHMALGTIMIATETMHVLATVTALGLLGVYVGESSGWIAFHGIHPDVTECGRACDLHLLAITVAMFGIIYLTDSVTSRFKRRNIELHHAKREMEEQAARLQQALEDIRRVEERKSHYMQISAHQLRSPLGTIKTTLRVLLDGYVDPSSEKGRKFLEGAVERVDELLAIVGDLLELAKVREGLEKAPWARNVNLNQLLADIFDSLEPAADAKNLRLVPDFRGVAVLEYGVPPDLVYAFENLVENAIKYSEQGGEVVVELRVVDGRARVRVMDRGIGIPEEMLDDIFLEFVRAPNAKRHTREGTGLGLSIVKEVIEAHGGRVWAERREGGGTVFVVELPLRGDPRPRSRDRNAGVTREEPAS